MTRRSTRFYVSLNRDKTMMGVEQNAFMVVAFFASILFAYQLYKALAFVPLLHMLMQWFTKKDYYFFRIFLRYLDEADAYSSVTRPDDWQRRPIGWGRGLPW